MEVSSFSPSSVSYATYSLPYGILKLSSFLQILAQQTSSNAQGTQTATIIGILPGLGAYNNDTSDSETTSSESEEDTKIVLPARIHVRVEQEWCILGYLQPTSVCDCKQVLHYMKKWH